jgi:tetratricopeptide (TPR) repeat protein/transcriptional regulator with XRE-family HTH domain
MAEPPVDGAGASDAGFGVLLRAYRERGLLSQERLAERSGVSTRTIRGLETGRVRRPQPESVRLLADALRLAGSQRERFERAARASPSPRRSLAKALASAAGEVMPCQLPPDVADFVGRAEVVRQLRNLLAGRSDGTAGEPDTAAVVISAVAGKAGVGKSALAVHVAHQLAAKFPDGQLYASLRGASAGTGGMSPLDPAEILGRFLRALGVDGAAVPADMEERAALYRSRLAGRRVLVVLDDAASEAQVRQLLPGDPSCAVLITSRARLAGLEGARLLHLDVLDTGQAVQLLARIAGPERVAAEPEAAVSIVVACGRLPLAVRIAGARLAARPHWRLDWLAGRLADERRRLDELAHGDLEVRASLSLSYRGLGQEQRRLFCRLGLLCVPDVAAWVAGALLDRPVAEAEALLEELVDAQLLDVAAWDPTGRPRYRLHDLLHAYARECAEAEEPVAQRRAALERALGGWLALAEEADQRLPSNLYGTDRGGAPRWLLTATTADAVLADPLAWFEAERVALVAAVDQAAGLGFNELAWDLAGSLINFLDLRGYYDDWRRTHEAALAAARRCGDRRGEASLLRGLGYLSIHWNDMGTALDYFTRALRILRRIGVRHGQAHAMEGIGAVHRLQGRYAEAAASYELAMAVFVELGDRRSQAWTRFQIAVLHAERGELGKARAGLEEALAAFAELGERRGVAWTQRRLGMVHAAQGDLDRAGVWLERSLAGLRGLGDRSTEALALRSLGELHLRCDERGKARWLFQECLVLARELDDKFVQALALRSLGDLHRLRADQDEATCWLKESTEIWRKLDMPLELARTLQLTGQVCLDAGSPAAAESAWREALGLLERGTPEAEQVATRLELLPPTSGGA